MTRPTADDIAVAAMSSTRRRPGRAPVRSSSARTCDARCGRVTRARVALGSRARRNRRRSGAICHARPPWCKISPAAFANLTAGRFDVNRRQDATGCRTRPNVRRDAIEPDVRRPRETGRRTRGHIPSSAVEFDRNTCLQALECNSST